MRTLTITYHASNNHGSFLQAYALQQTLIHHFGIENEIIDFRSKELLDNYKLFRPLNSPKNLFKNIYTLMHLSGLTVREKRFECLRSQYLTMTNRFCTAKDLLSLQAQCDLFIAGSDQIWNTTAPDFNIAFFLPGLTNKIAYGVSFGSHFDLSSLFDYESCISNFSAISVRDSQGKEQLSDLFHKSVFLVADPTLLLCREDYAVFEQETPLQTGDYIFYYSMKYTKAGLKQVTKLSQQHGIPVITVFTNYHTCYCSRYGIKIQYDAGPAEFIHLLSHAALVATDSYHGTVFSILYHKNFVYLKEPANADDRIDSLLKQLELYDIVASNTSTDACSESINNWPIETICSWHTIDNKVNELKLRSLTYLENLLTSESAEK